MNIFQIEDLSLELQSHLTVEKSPVVQFKLINSFFNKIILTNNYAVIEAYLTEFIPIYLDIIKSISLFGIAQEKIYEEINYLEKFSKNENFNDFKIDLNKNLERLKSESHQIYECLDGKEFTFEKTKLSFPINIHTKSKDNWYGQIETFTIKIHKDSTLSQNKFLIVPSSGKIEDRLYEQLQIGWKIAIKFLKKFYKSPSKFHEIVLIFDHKIGNLEGYSLGIAITLGFIQELFKFYNTNLSLSLNGNVTFTGGFTENGDVKTIGKEIIEQKTETVFYSQYNYFVVPELDSNFAKNRLTELKEKFPERRLKVINIEDFDDLLNRREIVNIEKAKVNERVGKLLKKNSVIIFLLAIIFSIMGLYLTYSIDNNPNGFKIVGTTVHIINQHGKILWSTKQSFGEKSLQIGTDDRHVHLLYDIDNDGTNEVLLANELNDNETQDKFRKITCYNNFGEIIWTYRFTDSISTANEVYDYRDYNSYMLGIVKENDKIILLGVARHLYIPSAIFKLDIKSGKRLNGTLWSQGHFRRGTVGDFNNDGKYEIFIGGISNDMESAFVLYVESDSLFGQTPNDIVQFKNIPKASLQHYFLLGKTDVCKFLNLRFNNVTVSHYDARTDEFYVNTSEGFLKQPIGVVYRFSNDFSVVKTQIGDDLQFIRDSLVIKGMLNPPLTNEPEFSQILLNGIKKWDGQKFVKITNP
ncbi:MAG: hypothetical protein H6610_01980 [Ignavibacteriales bacterium]|nr:hypothetical protein [Ignavibacteriales bacterium]MCB9218211.1 hypothetical protein [Ignavibacteriales bacterium]